MRHELQTSTLAFSLYSTSSCHDCLLLLRHYCFLSSPANQAIDWSGHLSMISSWLLHPGSWIQGELHGRSYFCLRLHRNNCQCIFSCVRFLSKDITLFYFSTIADLRRVLSFYLSSIHLCFFYRDDDDCITKSI
jgi:hypothetical protein